MGTKSTAGKPTNRRYSPEEKARAVRLVRQLRKELGTSHGTVQRVADQIGCGVESLRTWVKQADIDEGVEPGLTTTEAKRIKELEQENRELRRANDPRRIGPKFERRRQSVVTLPFEPHSRLDSATRVDPAV